MLFRHGANDTAMMEPSTQAAFPFLEEVRRSISEASPTGQDLSYDEIFLAIKTEIDEGGFSSQIDYERALKKDGSISTEGEGMDSSGIVERCRTLLLNRSKDLQVACYLTVGLARSEGAKGLVEGLAVINTLLEAFWEGLHPEKMKRRQGALQFLANRLKDWAGTRDFQAEARDDLIHAREEVGALQAFTTDHMEDFQPALSGLQQALEEALRRLPKEEATPPAQDEAPSEALPAPASSATLEAASGPAPALASPAASPAPTPTAAPAEPRSPAEAERLLLRMATFMREADRTNPVPYRLVRVLRWGMLREEPPHTDGRTLLEPFQPQRRDYLKGLLERGEYALLVEAAEGAFLDHPFWLDLQRYLDTAMEALGAPYAPAQEDILEETARLVRRFPRLPALVFSDGTPFADEPTLMWMETRVQGRLNGREEKGEAPARDGGPPVQARYEEARQHLGHGDLAEALAVMQAGAEGDASDRERFLRRFYLARLCMTGRQPAVARPLLERLDDEVARHALDLWEPVLTLEVWRELYCCYGLLISERTAEERQLLQERRDALFEKICKLDAAQGLLLLQQEQ